MNEPSSPPSGILQLWVRVQEVCDFISLEECRGFYASMLDQIAVVLAPAKAMDKFLSIFYIVVRKPSLCTYFSSTCLSTLL